MPGFTMDGENSPLPQRRDINELLTTGCFTTARGKSPGPASNAPPLLRPVERDAPRKRSRSRGRFKPPPRPRVEDEKVSLDRESSASRVLSWQSYDPPVRGIVDQNPIILEADVSRAEAARLQEMPCARDWEDGRRKERRDENPERRFVLIPKSDTHDPNEESEVESAMEKGYKSSSEGSGFRRVENGRKAPNGRSDTRRGDNEYRSSNDESEDRRRDKGYRSPKEESGFRRDEKSHKISNGDGEARRGENGYKLSNGEGEARRGDKSYRSLKDESEVRKGENSHNVSNGESEAEVTRTKMFNRPSDNEPRKEDKKESTRLGRTTKEARRTSYRGEAPRPDERRQSERPEAERRRSRQDLPVIETKMPREIPPQFRRSLSAMSHSAGAQGKVAFATPGTPAEMFLSPEVLRPSKDFHQVQQPVPRGNIHEALWGKNPTPVDMQRSANSLGSRPGTPVNEKRSSSSLGNRGRPPAEKLTRPQQLAGETVGRRQERHHSPAKSSRSSAHSAHDFSGSEDDSLGSDSDHHRRHSRRHREEDSKRRSPSRSTRSSLDVKSTSRFSSPLPSPKTSPSQLPIGERYDRAETFPVGIQDKKLISRPVSPLSVENIDRLTLTDNANSKSRQTSTTIPIHKSLSPLVPLGIAPLPIPIPSLSRESGRPPIVPPYEENRPLGPRPLPRAQSQAEQKPFWQPPSFHPPPQNSDKLIGSFRRFSEDVERGQIAPLPTCPRTISSRGRNDWLTLPRIGEVGNFDICPQCFYSTVAPTEFCGLFVPAWRPPETPILCDFGSSPWYRIAWLLTLKEKRHDLSLFYGLAAVAHSIDPCTGKHEAIRQWYSVKDSRTGGPVKDFDVCYSCVKSVEVLLPAVRGIFVKIDAYDKSPRICNLRFDSKRFVLYFDALETTADRSAKYAAPDTRDLVRLCRKLADIPECQQDTDIIDGKWRTITQLPEFTVCEDCFDEFVGPDIDDGKSIANMFSTKAKLLPRASCQLYGEKMRGIFRVAVDGDDYRYLANKARERRKAEDEYKRAVAELSRRPPGNLGIEREIKRREEEWGLWE